jgi:hypothetical protein
MATTHDLANVLDRLGDMFESLAKPYVPPPEEAAHLSNALRHLIAAYETRDFKPGEEALWNCHGITIDGEYKGEWEVTLRRTDKVALAIVDASLAEDSEAG